MCALVYDSGDPLKIHTKKLEIYSPTPAGKNTQKMLLEWRPGVGKLLPALLGGRRRIRNYSKITLKILPAATVSTAYSGNYSKNTPEILLVITGDCSNTQKITQKFLPAATVSTACSGNYSKKLQKYSW